MLSFSPWRAPSACCNPLAEWDWSGRVFLPWTESPPTSSPSSQPLLCSLHSVASQVPVEFLLYFSSLSWEESLNLGRLHSQQWNHSRILHQKLQSSFSTEARHQRCFPDSPLWQYFEHWHYWTWRSYHSFGVFQHGPRCPPLPFRTTRQCCSLHLGTSSSRQPPWSLNPIWSFLFLRICSYLRNQTSHRVGSGVKTTVGPRATCMTLQIKCTSSSFHDRLSFIKHL